MSRGRGSWGVGWCLRWGTGGGQWKEMKGNGIRVCVWSLFAKLIAGGGLCMSVPSLAFMGREVSVS
jgi:hypothetical protein